MPRPKKVALKDEAEEAIETVSSLPTELDELKALYQAMKDKGLNSIGDIEVRMSRLQ